MENKVLSETVKRGRGRPRTGKVLFAKRVTPEMAERLRVLLAGGVAAAVVQPVVAPSVEDKAKVEALLNNVVTLEAEVVDLKARLERCAMATDDQKALYWRMRALKAEGSVVKGEFDQT